MCIRDRHSHEERQNFNLNSLGVCRQFMVLFHVHILAWICGNYGSVLFGVMLLSLFFACFSYGQCYFFYILMYLFKVSSHIEWFGIIGHFLVAIVQVNKSLLVTTWISLYHLVHGFAPCWNKPLFLYPCLVTFFCCCCTTLDQANAIIVFSIYL